MRFIHSNRAVILNGTAALYHADYTPKTLSTLMPGHVEEVKAIAGQFGKNMAR